LGARRLRVAWFGLVTTITEPRPHGNLPVALGTESLAHYDPATRLGGSAIGVSGISATRFALQSAGSTNGTPILSWVLRSGQGWEGLRCHVR